MEWSKYNNIKLKLLFYNIFVFIFVISLIGILSNFNNRSIEVNESFAEKYKKLDKLYNSVEKTNDAARAALYFGEEASYQEYLDEMKKVKNLVNEIMYSENREIRWEMKKIKRMVITYDETFRSVYNHDGYKNMSYEETYDFFTRIGDNIGRTYRELAQLVIKEMEEKGQTLIRIRKSNEFYTWFIIMALFLGAVSFLVLAIIEISLPISRIIRNIERIKKENYDLHIIRSKDQDICKLDEAIKTMAKCIEENLANIKEKSILKNKLLEIENENLKVHDSLVEAELQVLQSQVNPHFLFNTLSMISKMAYLENAKKSSRLMEITSDLLRYSLDHATSISNLFGEIQCVENYFEIQRMRFGERVEFRMEIEEKLPNITLPGMIIQPLVENAVIHGVKDVMEEGLVEVKVFSLNQQLFICVDDNGSGMSSEKLESILITRDAETGKRKGIGISNVKERVEMFFGKKGVMQIESSEGCGSSFVFILPIVKGDQDV